MNSQQRNRSPYIFASIGNIILLTFLPLYFYIVGIFATGDVGGPLNFILFPCSNLFAATLFTLIIFFPLSKIIDWKFQKVSENGQRRINIFLFSVAFLALVFVFSGLALGLGLILENPLALRIIDGQDVDSVIVWIFRFLFLGGIPLLLGGPIYWFLLQMSRKLKLQQRT